MSEIEGKLQNQRKSRRKDRREDKEKLEHSAHFRPDRQEERPSRGGTPRMSEQRAPSLEDPQIEREGQAQG